VAIKGLYHLLIGEKFRGIRRQVGLDKLGKCGAQAMVICSKDTTSPHAVGDFEGRRKGPAKDAVK
jgi:hypothetical protein